jgi:hypothetical protein
LASARRAAARHGVTTGSFGVGLDRWRGAVYIAIALIAAAVVLFNRPVSVSAVIWTVIVALIAVVIVELLRRPAEEVAAAAASDTPEAGPAEPIDVDGERDTVALAGVAVGRDSGVSTSEDPSAIHPARRDG